MLHLATLGDEFYVFNRKKEASYFLTLHATHERGTLLRVKRCPFARCPGRLGGSIVGGGDRRANNRDPRT
jgi:hypothetical protein